LGIGHGEHGSFGHVEGLFKDTVDIGVLRRFSDLTGGRPLLVEGAKTQARDGKYRRIRVELKKQNLKARAREGR